jgi:hypothetical protein
MGFRQGNQPIEALPANGPDHSFTNRILASQQLHRVRSLKHP